MSKIGDGLHQFTVVISEEKFLRAHKFKSRSWRAIVEEALEREVVEATLLAGGSGPADSLNAAISRGLALGGSLKSVKENILREVKKFLLACTEKP